MDVINLDNSSVVVSLGTLVAVIFFVVNMTAKNTRLVARLEETEKQAEENKKGLDKANNTVIDTRIEIAEIKQMIKSVQNNIEFLKKK